MGSCLESSDSNLRWASLTFRAGGVFRLRLADTLSNNAKRLFRFETASGQPRRKRL